MSKFFFGDIALTKPEDVRPHLGDPDRHWKPRASAFELANSWIGSGSIPQSVIAVLSTCGEYEGVTLSRVSMEHETKIPGKGFNSQTDALVFADTPRGSLVISVEGKVLETFDKYVQDWAGGEPAGNRKTRVDGLKRILRLDADVLQLRYQLLHRAASAVLEARAFGAKHAVMLVHSFCPAHSSFKDFQSFAFAMQMPVTAVNMLSDARQIDDISLRIGWVADRPKD